MARPHDRHLDSDELDALIRSQAPGVADTVLSEQALREARLHIESCPDCERKVQMHRSVQNEISRQVAAKRSAPGPNCLDESEWERLAAGLFGKSETKEHMKHASQCEHCGPLLKAAVRGLSDQATADEEVVLASLSSARPDWQARMARTLKKEGAPRREVTSSFWSNLLQWPSPMFAVAALAVLIVGVWIGARMWRGPSTERLLAQAYTERRSIDVRIPGAKYAPSHVERGRSGSNFDKPQALLKAEELISESLAKNPNDPVMLDAKGRADLLDGNYDDAIKALERALETAPDDPTLLTDLGSAYYVRAQSADRPIDFGNAVESFGKALVRNPDYPIALFNRAIACEQIFLYAQAVDDWEHYLRLDPQGDWAEEARRRLASLQQKIKQHDKSMSEPLLKPENIAKQNADIADTRTSFNQRVEDYLTVATNEWLPNAYPVANSASTNVADYRFALQVLAEVSSKENSDHWLADVLAGASAPGFTRAVEHLALATKADDAGDNVSALAHAREAERLFSSGGNFAGSARARVESVFAAHDARDAKSCLEASAREQGKLKDRSYRWVTIQFHIEEGTCFSLAGNLGETRRLYQLASEEAKSSRYPVIYLRTQDHLSSLDSEDGHLAEGWSRTRQCLSLFWTGPYPPMRGYNLYFNLYEFARVSSQPHLQLAVWHNGVALADSFTDYVLSAMAHSLLANAEVAVGQPRSAEGEFQRSSELFAQAPQIKSTRVAHIEAESRLAEVETTEGKPQLAAARLRPYAPEVAELSNNFLGILYETALGGAEATSGNVSQAETALSSALRLSELHLGSIHDDRSATEWAERTADTYRNFAQLRLLQGDAQTALEIWEWYRGEALRAGKVGSAPGLSEASNAPAPQLVAERLPLLTDSTVLSYALLPRGLAIWIYDDRGIFAHWAESNPSTISQIVDRFRGQCANPRSDIDGLRRNSRWLYDVLIAPIESHLSADRTLIVELDDAISGLPFEALLDPQDRYIGDRYTIVSSLGLYYQSGRRQTPLRADAHALIVVVSKSSSGEYAGEPLPDAVAEGEMVAGDFKGADLITESGATTDAVLAKLSSAAVFHFAGHAVSSPIQSGLLLADRLLTPDSLGKRSLGQMQLAVFSACNTQNGSSGGAGSADSLVRVFLRAGAARVIASRWKVDSAVTRDFMDLFYRAVLTGKTVPEAMHQARSTVHYRMGLAHPYYWSAFAAFGAI